MFNMNNIWNNVKHFNNYEKGKCGINYGYCQKKRHNGYNNYRKAKRQIRKYGFDFSEVWNLDSTIMRWMSDTYGGILKLAGYTDYWGYTNIDDIVYNNKLYETRETAYFEEFRKVYKENTEEVNNFILPRLKVFKKILHGYPASLESFDCWHNIIDSMINEMEEGKYSELLIEYLFNLWD